MRCEQCNEREAAVVVTVSLDGEALQRRQLCRACLEAQQRGQAGASAGSKRAKNATTAAENLVCAACGLRLAESCRTGQVGCSECYCSFESHLVTLLEETCGPEYFSRDFGAAGTGVRGGSLRNQLLELERALEDAVREERYEVAAQIRDEIEILKAALEPQ